MKILYLVAVGHETIDGRELAKKLNADCFDAVLNVPNAEKALYDNKLGEYAEQVLSDFYERANHAEIFVLNGIPNHHPFSFELNFTVAQALSATVVLVVDKSNRSQINYALHQFPDAILIDDVDKAVVEALPEQENSLSGAQFRYNLVQRAIKGAKTIVLPEGDESRTVAAAAICGKRGLATCVLLAEPSSVEKVLQEKGLTLNERVKIINPADIRENYVARLVELRQAKGMTEALAREQLQDNVMLGTMMLEMGEVDGLVSGAVHSTANTIRPALQIIKTTKNVSTVSSVFFMCLPNQVMVYGDCGVVPSPNADELASIAIQSHDSARAFGIEPKVAMLSYSTFDSGAGPDVDLVKEATAKVKALRPDILVDGPLQYDSATDMTVAKAKAPHSPVAGQANVFIFPDLSAGNIGYKAVQRTAHAIAMGPVLQGMRKPVNDLSRGALIEDIVYTIAITAVQAVQSGH